MIRFSKRTLLFIPVFLTAVISVFSSSFDVENHYRLQNTEKASAPYVSGNVIIFSYKAEKGTQSVSLALESEKYRKFHTFSRNQFNIFILALPLPENQNIIRYRLIVDGLWTTDPSSPAETDARGIAVSEFLIPSGTRKPSPGVIKQNGTTEFIYHGKPGDRVSLVGDFNRWDPYLTPMNESPVYPGVFSTKIKLPPGAKFYRFVVNGKEITDPENPFLSGNIWGERASVIPGNQ